MLRVHELSVEEGQALSRLVKRSNDPTVVKRAMIILHSLQGFSPPTIAGMVLWSEDWVRRVINDYNRIGRAPSTRRRAPDPSRSSLLRFARRSSPSPSPDLMTTVGKVPPVGRLTS